MCLCNIHDVRNEIQNWCTLVWSNYSNELLVTMLFICYASSTHAKSVYYLNYLSNWKKKIKYHYHTIDTFCKCRTCIWIAYELSLKVHLNNLTRLKYMSSGIHFWRHGCCTDTYDVPIKTSAVAGEICVKAYSFFVVENTRDLVWKGLALSKYTYCFRRWDRVRKLFKPFFNLTSSN